MSALRNFIVTMLLSLVIFGVIAYGLIKFTTNALKDEAEGEETKTVDTADGTDGEIVEPSGADISMVNGDSFTILFVGTDYQPSVFTDYDVTGQTDHNGFPLEPRPVLSDTVVLVRVDKESGDCVFCAIPSKTTVSIDGLTSHLDELYSAKGIDALCSKVMSLTGLPIDYYALISAENFKGLIDAFGGVTYYVSTNMSYTDNENSLSVNLKKGSQKLTGQKALDMLRYPAYSDGDVSKRKCAVSFLKAMFKLWLTTANESDCKNLYTTYAGFFETNMTVNDVTENAELIFAYSRMNLIEYSYPGSVSGSGDDEFFNPNVSKAVEYFHKYKFQG